MSTLRTLIRDRITQVKCHYNYLMFIQMSFEEDENEVQRQPDLDYEEMLDELESHVHSDSDRER